MVPVKARDEGDVDIAIAFPGSEDRLLSRLRLGIDLPASKTTGGTDSRRVTRQASRRRRPRPELYPRRRLRRFGWNSPSSSTPSLPAL